jgi:hypothetical protein
MKWCTRMRIRSWHVDGTGTFVADDTELLDLSLVDDDHEFGVSADGRELHFEATMKPLDGSIGVPVD